MPNVPTPKGVGMLAPPVEQPHVERERLLAAAESRMPRLGSAAYRELPLTGAIQASFPAYRQRPHFGDIGNVTQLAESAARSVTRRLEDMYTLDEEGKILDVLLPDGTPSTDADRVNDARQWARHYGQDVFNNHCLNHEHDCKATCVKYVKKRLEAKNSLRPNKVPTCRFWFFRRVKVKDKYKRRRGKPLVSTVFIAEDDERKQEFRCQVVREQPFRSTSNDVAQATDRCNVDYQFLCCAPPLPIDDTATDAYGKAPQLTPCSVPAVRSVAQPSANHRVTRKTRPHAVGSVAQPSASRRLTRKTRPQATKVVSQPRFKTPSWFIISPWDTPNRGGVPPPKILRM